LPTVSPAFREIKDPMRYSKTLNDNEIRNMKGVEDTTLLILLKPGNNIYERMM